MINSKKIDCYSSDVSLLYRSGKLEYLKKSQKQTKMDFLFEGGGQDQLMFSPINL